MTKPSFKPGSGPAAQMSGFMNKIHIAALACFGIAFLLYFVASSSIVGGGFAFLGFFFEIMAWRKASGTDGEEK